MEQKMTFDQYIRMRERNADFARALARTNLALRCWERSEMWDEICAAQSMKIMWLLDNHILQAFYKRCGIDVLPLSIGGMYGYGRKVCIHPHNCKQVKEEKELSLLATSSGRVDGDYPGPKIILSKELEAGANPIGLLERATLAAVGGWPSKCNCTGCQHKKDADIYLTIHQILTLYVVMGYGVKETPILGLSTGYTGGSTHTLAIMGLCKKETFTYDWFDCRTFWINRRNGILVYGGGRSAIIVPYEKWCNGSVEKGLRWILENFAGEE